MTPPGPAGAHGTVGLGQQLCDENAGGWALGNNSRRLILHKHEQKVKVTLSARRGSGRFSRQTRGPRGKKEIKVVKFDFSAVRTMIAGLGIAIVAGLAASGPAYAQGKGWNETYIPTIWVDPDGCEHWVMDDGLEGYMSPHTNRQGIPVCRRGNVCGVMQSDQFFATNSHKIDAQGQARLVKFFRETRARSFTITGHTDSRGSDAHNLRLSRARADAVAQVARAAGANISQVRGLGERKPVASNGTSAGMAKNRRVEIVCVR